MCAWVHAEQTDWISLSERAIWHWESKLDWPLHSPFLPSLTCSSWTVPRHVRMKISTQFWLCITCFSAPLCNKSCTRSKALTHSKTTSQREGPFPYKSPTHWSIAGFICRASSGKCVCVYRTFDLTDCEIHSQPHFVLCRHSVLPNKLWEQLSCVWNSILNEEKVGCIQPSGICADGYPWSSYTPELSLARQLTSALGDE